MYILTSTVVPGIHARNDSQGEFDNKTTDDVGNAKEFPNFKAAFEFAQNFSAKWQVVPTHDMNQTIPVMPADFHRSYRYDY